MKWIKRLTLTLASLALIAAIGAFALLWYAQPDEELNLDYEELSIYRKAEEMIRNRELALAFSEEEVNHLLKKAIVDHVELPPEVDITGAKFELGNARLIAHLQVKYQQAVSAGVTLEYAVHWQAPELVISLDRIAVKQLPLPAFIDRSSYRISLEDQLPSVIDVADVSVQPSGVRLEFAVDPEQLNQLLEELQNQLENQLQNF